MTPSLFQRLTNGGAARRIIVAAALAACSLPSYADTPIVPDASHLSSIDAPGLKREIAGRAGKVVVVNFWATWCDPCKAEFPDLVKLAAKEKSKGLDLVTVSFDDTASIPKGVVPFLAKNHATTGTFVNKSGSHLDDAFLTWLEPNLPADDAIGLPRTYIFDRKGKLAKVLVGGQTYAGFEAAVKPILGAN